MKTEIKFTEIFLPRDNKRPLAVKAALIGSSETSTNSEGGQNKRWCACCIYKTPTGYLAHVMGKTLVFGETERNWVCEAKNPASLAQAIEAHYGTVKTAIILALKDADIYNQSAAKAGEQYSDVIVDNRAEKFIAFSRKECVDVFVNNNKIDNCVTLSHGAQEIMSIDDAEAFALLLLDAIIAAREMK